jgi:hypothetical protein
LPISRITILLGGGVEVGEGYSEGPLLILAYLRSIIYSDASIIRAYI